jgi:hypothetical protein
VSNKYILYSSIQYQLDSQIKIFYLEINRYLLSFHVHFSKKSNGAHVLSCPSIALPMTGVLVPQKLEILAVVGLFGCVQVLKVVALLLHNSKFGCMSFN